MTTLESSSDAESSMDDSSNGDLPLQNLTKKRSFSDSDRRTGDGENGVDGHGDGEAWETFSKSFRQVQSVLDQNRVLIQQVNENHQSKIRDNLTKNVALIREINGNISKVVSLYSSLSSNFSNIFHQRPGILDGTSNDVNSKGGNTEA